jgi:hypothetical protein
MAKTGHKSLRSVQRYVNQASPPSTRPPRHCPAPDEGADSHNARLDDLCEGVAEGMKRGCP